MVKFKCLLSGNIGTFTEEHDIKTMREHPDYIEVKEEKQTAAATEEAPAKRTIGRPPKQKE